MANATFEVTVIDLWPKIKLLVQRRGNVREEGPVMYDIATSQFEPAVKDTLRLAVEEVINTHKGGR